MTGMSLPLGCREGQRFLGRCYLTVRSFKRGANFYLKHTPVEHNMSAYDGPEQSPPDKRWK